MSNEQNTASPEAIQEFKQLMQDPAARQAFIEMKAGAREAGARPRYDRVLRVVSEEAWAIRPSYLAIITDVLAMRLAGAPLSSGEIEARLSAAEQRPKPTPSAGGVAVIPVKGVIAPHAGAMDEMSGGMSLSSFRNEFRTAMASSEVGAIVLDIDSPGGVASGIAEMADEIRSARGSKKVVAVANHSAASAAYWLASAADELVVTKSGRVGAIGVYTAHENRAAQLAAEGVQTTLVSAGKFKTEGNPFEPLTEDAREHMQEMVDDMYGMFVASVAKGRGVSVNEVRNGFGQGRLEMGRKAVALGMADRVGSIDSVVEELLRGGRRPAAAVAATTVADLEAADASAEMADAEKMYDLAIEAGTWVERDGEYDIEGYINERLSGFVAKEFAETPTVPDEIEELEKQRRELSGEPDPEPVVVEPDDDEETSEDPADPDEGDEEATEPTAKTDDELLILEAEIASLSK